LFRHLLLPILISKLNSIFENDCSSIWTEEQKYLLPWASTGGDFIIKLIILKLSMEYKHINSSTTPDTVA
ncbi:MAG: hypothetical protein ACK2UP_10735, partial [Candidatus Promineifilaceae bacterium]